MKENVWQEIRRHEGENVWVTLAYGETLLCRVDMELDTVTEEDGRLSLVGSFRDTGTMALYREVSLPLPEDEEGVYATTFGGETRVETSDGFFLLLVPL